MKRFLRLTGALFALDLLVSLVFATGAQSCRRCRLNDCAFVIVALLIGLAGMGAAHAATANTTVDVSPTIDLVTGYIVPLVQWVIGFTVLLFGQRFPMIAPLIQLALSASSARDNEKIETAIKHGLTLAVNRINGGSMAIDVRSGLAAQVALWVQDQMPQRLNRLGLTPEVLVSRVEAIAASHLSGAAQVATTDVAPPPATAARSDVPKGL